MFRTLIIAGVWAVVNARRSPNADLVENLNNTANNVTEDAVLDVPDLIAKYGYPVEVHHVQTSDGYILEMHRIPHGRDKNNVPGTRQAVFIMHGLLCSSADFVVLGPDNALSYLLAEEGYDVWLGNARGNYYSRKHISLDPDEVGGNFWKFSWEEIGLYDLPAFIDYILAITGNSKVHYVGHSQGGTTFLVLNSLRPEYNEKFISFQGMAPASYFDHNEKSIYKKLSKYERLIESTAFKVGTGEILPNSAPLLPILKLVCPASTTFEPLCAGKVNMNQTDMAPLFLANTPAGSSIRQVTHYAQVIRRKAFARFYHDTITNLNLYGSISPPEFNVSKITVPTYLHYGVADTEVNYRDLFTLAQRMANVVAVHRSERETFKHFDFIWGNDVKSVVYETLIEYLADAEERQVI